MPSKASSRSTSLKKSQSKASLASTNSSITSDDRRSKGNKGKRRDRRVEDSSGPSQLSVEAKWGKLHHLIPRMKVGDFTGDGPWQLELQWALASGAAYGMTATLLGQPLDTIKTWMQSLGWTFSVFGDDLREGKGLMTSFQPNFLEVMERTEAAGLGLGWKRRMRQASAVSMLRTVYGGSAAVLLGSVLFRSLPFAVYSGVYASLPPLNLLGLDGRVYLSGMVSGMARASVETPCEALKTQKQVWSKTYFDSLRAGYMWQGFSATCSRNMILVTMFFALSDQLNNMGFRDQPFLRGSCVTICCWLVAWPLDVVKSQMQAVQVATRGAMNRGAGGMVMLLRNAWHNQMLYRGLMPGLLRACLANGSGMYAYQQEISEEVVDYDGPRPDEEFLQAVRIELQESAHSVRRAEESIPFAYALQLSGKGQRLQKEEPIALERLVAVDWWAGGIV
eukprot:symbB.v1.2.031938.t2/scaffold3765.1/size50745/4